MPQWRGPGTIGTQFGLERIEETNSSANRVGVGSLKTRGWVTTRMKPLSTRSVIPNADSESSQASSQAR